MQPIIKRLDELTVIGLAATFISIRSPEANNFEVIPALWDRLIGRIDEIPGRREHVSLGLCCPLPPQIERSHPDEFYYIAGFPVDATGPVPDGMVMRRVAAGRYAMFTHRGPLGELGATVDYIYGTWMPTAKREPGNHDRPDIEWYDERFDPASTTSEIDIYVPIGG